LSFEYWSQTFITFIISEKYSNSKATGLAFGNLNFVLIPEKQIFDFNIIK